MPTRTKPESCCAVRPVRPLSKGKRDRFVALSKALADPNRLEILRFVSAQSGPVCACDVVDHFELKQPTISHHLKTLSEADLLTSERNGLWMFYEVNADVSKRMTALINAAFA